MDFFQRTQQGFQCVGEGQGRGGVGQQEGAGHQQHDTHHHKKGVKDALPGDFKDPESGNDVLPGIVESIENGGEHQQEHHRLHPPQDGFGGDGGQLYRPGQYQEHQGISHPPLGQEQRHDITHHADELGAGIQAVDNGLSREILAQSDVFQRHSDRTSFLRRSLL